MINLAHIIKDPEGLHARPAALLCSAVKDLQGDVMLRVGERSASARDLFGIMALDAMPGEELSVEINAPDEEAMAKALEEVLATF